MHVQVVDMTPAEAARLLEANTRNRPVRENRVTNLAAAIERGEWVTNGDAVRVATDGSLLDGQHRLLAIVRSGATLPMLLVTGLEPEAQATMDTGARRSLSDVLHLRGERNTRTLAALLRALHAYRQTGRLTGNRELGGKVYAPTVAQALALLDAEPAIRDVAPDGHRIARAGLGIPPALGALLLYAFEEVDPDEAGPFFDALVGGDGLPAGDPILALRRNLMTRRVSPGGEYIAAVTIKSYNLWRAGRSVQTLSWRPGGSAPEPFPTINPPEDHA